MYVFNFVEMFFNGFKKLFMDVFCVMSTVVFLVFLVIIIIINDSI